MLLQKSALLIVKNHATQ